ncbi:MAG: hypothetical protein JO202_05770 [Ktedonobacteraceae bacterium]|nr:hypothetical protein [Ktedonobacteraceae bacterium]
MVIDEDLALARPFGPYHLIVDTLGGKSLATALALLVPGGTAVNRGFILEKIFPFFKGISKKVMPLA